MPNSRGWVDRLQDEFDLYCAVKDASVHVNDKFLSAADASEFMDEMERLRPELVAACRAKIRLGIL